MIKSTENGGYLDIETTDYLHDILVLFIKKVGQARVAIETGRARGEAASEGGEALPQRQTAREQGALGRALVQKSI